MLKDLEIEKQSKFTEPEKLNITIPAIEAENLSPEKTKLSLSDQLDFFTNGKVGLEFLVNFFYSKFKHSLEELVRILNQPPIKVNPIHVLLIEFIFDLSNHKPLKYKFIDDKLQVEFGEEAPFKRISLLDFADIQRFNMVNLHKFADISADNNTLDSDSHQLFTENLSSKNPKYPLYFAFTFSQCSVFNIKEFLNFQKSLFEGDFNDFLKITALVYKSLFSEIQLTLLNNINFNKKLELTNFPSEYILNNKEINFSEDNVLNIALCLQPYIESSHYEILIKALRGEIIDKPVHFKGSSSEFARQLKSLYENDFVQEKNLDRVVDWAIKYFIFDSRLNGIGQPAKKSHFEREIKQKLPKRFQSFFENLIKNN